MIIALREAELTEHKLVLLQMLLPLKFVPRSNLLMGNALSKSDAAVGTIIAIFIFIVK